MAKGKKKGGKKSRRQQKHYSGLEHHKRLGKVLTPPLLTIPGLRPSSWLDDRLPEMLWPALLIAHMPRDLALEIFRRVAKALEGSFTPNKTIDIGHSGLADLSPELAESVIKLICSAPGAREVLRPLVMLGALPLLELWRQEIGLESRPEEDWEHLRVAVAHVFDHQSQEATDCRWLRVLVMLVSGQLKLPSVEMIEEIIYYPVRGDQRKVRPLIRSMEISFADGPTGVRRQWPGQFWDQCWTDTKCIPHELTLGKKAETTGTTTERVNALASALQRHSLITSRSTSADARQESVFGLAQYGLSILRELLRVGVSTGILARLGLRALLETQITLAALLKTDLPEVWEAYRRYGTGQAKLAFLKLDDEDVRRVGFVNAELLNSIANEDRSLEFVPINLGHWDSTNLRQLSEQADSKDNYDRYYPWTSAYMHANWGAVRSVGFDLCVNALHRAHRVLRTDPPALNDVVSDACELIDGILEAVDRAYPKFPMRCADTLPVIGGTGVGPIGLGPET